MSGSGGTRADRGVRPTWALLVLLAGSAAWAQTGTTWPSPSYSYDYTWTPGGSTTHWQANGGASFGSSSITFGSGGSVVLNTTLTTNPNDYEVAGQFSAVSGGDYVEFLRSTSVNTVPGSGNYIAMVLNVETYTGSPSTAAAVLGLYEFNASKSS